LHLEALARPAQAKRILFDNGDDGQHILIVALRIPLGNPPPFRSLT
jgi:hypothetical protein